MSNINRANGTPPLMQYDASYYSITKRDYCKVSIPPYTCCIVKI